MRTLDWTPYRRATVGYDRLFDFLENSTAAAENYPPFDIERVSDDQYRVTLAVAGFRQDEIDITAHQNVLTVTGRKSDNAETDKRVLLHNGIANRAFERRFQLADYVRVTSAALADGLLMIDLLREVPEAMKPYKVAVTTGTEPATISAAEDTELRAA